MFANKVTYTELNTLASELYRTLNNNQKKSSKTYASLI